MKANIHQTQLSPSSTAAAVQGKGRGSRLWGHGEDAALWERQESAK